LDEVGGEHSTTAQREFFCRILIDADRAIAPSFKSSHIAAHCDLEHVKWGLFGDSGGVRDLTVFLEAGYSHDLGKPLIRSELWFPKGTPTSVIVAAVKAKWPDHKTLILDA
ncbi:hypothetical protein, partial [Glaesserella parasuis]|uniref:hypothetical protein n=1 Tax=Glaesserella parasuis TaxID=738 RepID=UPI003F414974